MNTQMNLKDLYTTFNNLDDTYPSDSYDYVYNAILSILNSDDISDADINLYLANTDNICDEIEAIYDKFPSLNLHFVTLVTPLLDEEDVENILDNAIIHHDQPIISFLQGKGFFSKYIPVRRIEIEQIEVKPRESICVSDIEDYEDN